jgi:hypothetical protein
VSPIANIIQEMQRAMDPAERIQQFVSTNAVKRRRRKKANTS